MNNTTRRIERVSLVVVTIVLGLFFLILRSNYSDKFERVDENYKNQTTVNLDRAFDPQLLARVLVEGDYIPDDTSALFIAHHIKKLVEEKPLPNLGELKKRGALISVSEIDTLGGQYLKTRVNESRKQLRNTDALLKIAADNPYHPQGGHCAIKVKVQEFDSTANFIWKALDKNIKAVPAVLVQLTEHFYDSITNAPDTSILGYVMTDNKGIAVFDSLKADGYYSVLPVRKDFEYGNSKGTTTGNLGSMKVKDRTFTFTQREHKIAPFDPSTFSNLKEDETITVRTPQDFKSKLTTNLIFILLAWWLLHLFLCMRKRESNQLILPLIMLLSGISLLMMYAIYNPLTDNMLGNDTATGILVGIAAIAILSEINVVTFFEGNYRFLGKWDGQRKIRFDVVRLLVVWAAGIFGKKFQERVAKLPEGSGYLILALVLTALLFSPFGTGPEGSGVRVNLFFFQPGEIAKYLIIIFLSAFFCKNAETIHTFSEKFSIDGYIKIHVRSVIIIFVSLSILLLMYVALGDMGPGLVLGISFILIYSVVRKDLPQLIAGVVTFAAFLFAAHLFFPDSKSAMFFIALAWFVLWLIYGFFIYKQKQLFESAIFLNFAIAVFIFGAPVLEKVGMHSTAERMAGRIEICANTWNNEASGGDQVAQGLWSLASGGIFGQGLGKGNPNLVPAAHTDMIFTSIGEEIGWTGLLLIICCLAILLYITLIAGRRNGHPFAFYLSAGIAIITGVQFMVITLGCLGIIPLTGIVVPFLSFGKVSMIINMLAFGIVLSISNTEGTPNQDKQLDIYKFIIRICKYGFAAFAVVIVGILCWYQFGLFGLLGRNYTLIRPALMSNKQGERIREYNPRIQLLMKNMDAGNIYDRNGILLATNDKKQIEDSFAKYIVAGIDKQKLTDELKKRKRRYYPFGDHLFFWLGDFNNTDILWNDNENDPRGYIAERRHLAALRGFDNLNYEDREKTKIKYRYLKATKYKGSPFSEEITKKDSIKFTDYDYTFLLPFLKDGINGHKVKKHNAQREKKRDIRLTLDAKLQTTMQNDLAAYVTTNFTDPKWKKLRISVVVLNAANGDLLCSANYPLPNMEILKDNQGAYNDIKSNDNAYTDRDLGLTYQTPPGSTAKVMSALAGLQKIGTKVANRKYYVYNKEIIERNPDEPNEYNVTMEDAIVLSSNCYFINLVNKNNLYPNLDNIYQAVGIRIDKPYTKTTNGKTKTLSKALTPYFLTPNANDEKQQEYTDEILAVGEKGMRKYENYVEKRDDKRNKSPIYEKMSGGDWNYCAWAWGQGSMSATPLNMARIAAIVANGGKLAETQFIKQGNKILATPTTKTTPIISTAEANILKTYMQKESTKHRNNGYAFPEGVGMGGKTGTPEREMKIGRRYADIDARKDGKMNDGWYIFFIDSKEKEPLAVAIRMERLGSGISGNAVRLTDKVVIKTLKELGYIN